MRFVFLSLMLFPAFALGQTPQPPPTPSALFQRVRTRLLADANRKPRYTCLQNITRHFYRASSSDPQTCAAILSKRAQRKHDPPATSWDRLQLDVAIANDHEIHSWPDAPRFNEEEIRKLISNGPFGSGDFRNFVSAIFSGAATIKFGSRRMVSGQTLFEYTFDVPKRTSQYQIEIAPASLITAYSGSFLLDPQSADLVHLTIRTAELPENTSACQAIDEIEYGRTDIHGQAVLIPQETDWRVVYRSGREAVASTSYSSCHEYGSTSVLRFDALESAPASAVPSVPVPAVNTPPRSPFPPGLTFNCRIVTPIDSDSSAGLPVEAILRSPLRGKDKTILAPQGARIHGRLVRLADHKSSLDYFEVGVHLESIEVNGAKLPLYATLENQAEPPVGSFASGSRPEQFADFPTAPPRNVGVFFFVRENLRLPQFDSIWITASPEREKENRVAANSEKQQQALDKEVKKVVLAINLSQKAVDLQNMTPSPTPGTSCDFPNLQDIVADRQKAIEAGKSADASVLNTLYAGLGDRFKYEFLESLSLFVHGCAMQSQYEGTSSRDVDQSRFLWRQWADWYGAHRQAIEEAVNLHKLDAEWPAAPPSATDQHPGPTPVPPASSAPPSATTQAQAEPPPDKAPQTYEISAPSPVAQDSPPANPTAAAPPEKPAASSVAEGTAILAVLSKSVDAKKNKVGDKVEAKTTAALTLPRGIVLARDTRIEGHISNVKAKSKDSAGAMVEITFDRALTADGRDLPLQATLQAVGRPLTKAPAAMDDSMVSAGPGIPAAGSASGVPPPRGSPGPPPSEPPQVSNPDSGAAMPGEHDPEALNADSRGVVGLKGLSLSASSTASVITSEKGNVHLDSGTQLILRTQ